MSEDLIFVQNLIYEFRGRKVMLDFDLARLYHCRDTRTEPVCQKKFEKVPCGFYVPIDF